MASYYRNLAVWKRAFELNVMVHNLLEKFPEKERFALTDQLRRATLSIASNIVEGSGRGTDADYVRFLQIAKGSAMEVETQLLIAKEFGYITDTELGASLSLVDEIIRMIFGMIKK